MISTFRGLWQEWEKRFHALCQKPFWIWPLETRRFPLLLCLFNSDVLVFRVGRLRNASNVNTKLRSELSLLRFRSLIQLRQEPQWKETVSLSSVQQAVYNGG